MNSMVLTFMTFIIYPKKFMFTPIKQSYTHELERITTWVHIRKIKKIWASKAKLMGSFEV
jgi:hypothetical protein